MDTRQAPFKNILGMFISGTLTLLVTSGCGASVVTDLCTDGQQRCNLDSTHVQECVSGTWADGADCLAQGKDCVATGASTAECIDPLVESCEDVECPLYALCDDETLECECLAGYDPIDGGCWRTPDAPELYLSPRAIKLFRFTWTNDTGAAEYRLLEDPDGAGVYTPVASIVAGMASHDLSVPLPQRINAVYVLEACNPLGCASSAPVHVHGTLADAIGYFKASNTRAGHWFGYAVRLSGDGNTLAVGTPFENSGATGINGDQADTSVSGAGVVYVFTRAGDTWRQQAYIKASNTGLGDYQGFAHGDYFGYSLALSESGNTLAVGAPTEESSATGVNGDQTDSSANEAGAVYVFTRSDATWSQQAYIKASNTAVDDLWFGHSISLSSDGNTLAVGAPFENSGATGINGDQNDDGALGSGAVYVFTRSDAVWSQQAYVKSSRTWRDYRFGSSVSLSGDGDLMAVGSFLETNPDSGYHSGAAYIFARDAGTWSQQAYLLASNPFGGDHFGFSLALSKNGSTLAVSAPREAGGSTGINGDQSRSMSSLRSGAVYVFTQDAGVWNQQAYIKASNAEADDHFGVSLSLSEDGDILAVGAYFEDSYAIGINSYETDNSVADSGAAYLFMRDNDSWRQQAYVKGSNTDFGARFGHSVSLSDAGDILAIGAFGENSQASGIGGDQADVSASESGAVYLY